jgi:hypothetical protein
MTAQEIAAGWKIDNTTITATGNLMSASGSIGVSATLSPADTATTGTSGNMLGLGSTITYTPSINGKLTVMITGSLSSASGAFYASTIIAISGAVNYGTGTAPAYNAAATGTTAATIKMNITSTAIPTFSVVFRLTGLTIGTAYWFDIQANWGYPSTVGVNAVIIEG